MAKATEEAPDEAVRRTVAAWVNATRPSAVRCRILIDYPNDAGRDSIAVPLVPTDGDDLEAMALTELGKLKPGEWMKGRVLAAAVGVDDPNNGHFKRTMARLSAGPVESTRHNGYRLKQ